MSSEEKDDPLINLPGFWDKVKSAGTIFLGLDYDGTLAPFKVERMEATPLDGIPGLLRKINENGSIKLAILSGRPIDEIRQLIGDMDIAMAGSHGYEYYVPGIGEHEMSLTPMQKIGFERGEKIAIEYNFNNNIEAKIGSIAAHTRPLDDEKTILIDEELHKKWTDMADGYQLEVIRFNGGVELRSPGYDKGLILIKLMKMYPADLTVYIGDDTTDEDAFMALGQGGIGIRVGSPDEESSADGYIKDIGGVKDFLEKLIGYFAAVS
ncbi:MAG TPA: trehalose-phosphatase [bacterium]